MHYKKKHEDRKWGRMAPRCFFLRRCNLRRAHQAPLNVIDCHLRLSVLLISREISRLRISDCLCLTAFGAYLRLCSSKVTRKNASRRQLVWAHRDEITSYASRSRRCNAIATTQVQRHQHASSLLRYIVAALHLHARCIAHSSSDRPTL